MDKDYKLKPEQYFEHDIESIRNVRTNTYGMGPYIDSQFKRFALCYETIFLNGLNSIEVRRYEDITSPIWHDVYQEYKGEPIREKIIGFEYTGLPYNTPPSTYECTIALANALRHCDYEGRVLGVEHMLDGFKIRYVLYNNK